MIKTKSGVKEVKISAKITRKDGTVEDLGVVSYQHRSRLKTLGWKLYNWVGKQIKRLGGDYQCQR